MKNLYLIAAIGKNNELGIDNHLIWHLKEDLKYFKDMTVNKTVIMGRKCFESLPGLLPNRKSIILSTNKDYKVAGAIICHDIKEVLHFINNTNEEYFIIGGEKIYREFLPYCDALYLTEINASEDKADTYFPTFNKNQFNKRIIKKVTENNIDYQFTIYRRI